MRYYAVKFQIQNPDKPLGMPDNWIWMEQETNGIYFEALKSHGWTILNSTDYQEHLNKYQDDFDFYFKNYVSSDSNFKLKVIPLVKDEFKFLHESKIDFRRHLKQYVNLNKKVVMLRDGRPDKSEYYFNDEKICEIKFNFDVDAFNFVTKRTEFLGYVTESGQIESYWPIHEKIYSSANTKDLMDMIKERYDARVIIFDEIKAILNVFLVKKYLITGLKTYPEVLELAGNFWDKYSNLIDSWFNTGTPKLKETILLDLSEPLLDEVIPKELIQEENDKTIRDYIAERITY